MDHGSGAPHLCACGVNMKKDRFLFIFMKVILKKYKKVKRKEVYIFQYVSIYLNEFYTEIEKMSSIYLLFFCLLICLIYCAPNYRIIVAVKQTNKNKE